MMHHSLKLPKMKLTTTITTHIFSGELIRHLSTAYATGNTAAQVITVRKEYLFQKLFELDFNGGDVSSVLHRTMRSGKQIPKSVLILCLKDLRKFNRYHHCLQILDWMEKGRYDYSSRDFALRVDIMCKHKGLAEAEKCFDGIPSDMKNHYSVYGALLNCYCSELATDKALAFFKKMDEMGYASNVLPFNNLLSLFVKIDQPEKVAELIADMKNRNVPLNSHTYSLWIQSHRLLGDLEGVERVFHEAQSVQDDDYVILSNVASVFIEFNQLEKAISQLENLENVLDNSNYSNRNTYHHLISLYAAAGKLESVIRVWNKLKPKFKVNRLSYLALLQALSKLDDIKGMEKYFQEWESSGQSYDDRLPAALIGAYLKHDMLEEAELLMKDATIKAGKLLRAPHVKFMNYYFEKRQTDYALKHMEAAVDAKWKPVVEKLDSCFEYFKAEKDVDGAENFCRLLKKAKALDSKAYIWLLQMYVDAEKTAIDMRQRVEEDGINITLELEELLERVCPNRF